MKAVVFDLDGTLIDSVPDIHAAVNLTLDALSVERLDIATVRSFVGNGVPVLIERVKATCGINDGTATHGDMVTTFLSHYEKAPAELTTLYPGVQSCLDRLRAAGWQLGICTNKPEKPSRDIVDAFKLTDYFGAIMGGDSLPVRKPDPAPLQATFEALNATNRFYVGDSEVDAATAQNANVPFALYTEGYRKTPVEELHHDYLFNHFDKLIDWLPDT